MLISVRWNIFTLSESNAKRYRLMIFYTNRLGYTVFTKGVLTSVFWCAQTTTKCFTSDSTRCSLAWSKKANKRRSSICEVWHKWFG